MTKEISKIGDSSAGANGEILGGVIGVSLKGKYGSDVFEEEKGKIKIPTSSGHLKNKQSQTANREHPVCKLGSICLEKEERRFGPKGKF